jgi:type VI protein secretion system component Hcp
MSLRTLTIAAPLIKEKKKDMFRPISLAGKLALAACLCCTPMSFGQTVVASVSPDITKITVSVDGLTCGTSTAGSFEALAFSIGVNDIISEGGAGVGKVTATDLVVQKASDACSVPLMLMTASGRPAAHVVLSAVSKGNKPVLTITLAGVILSSHKLTGAEAAKDAQNERVTFTYTSAVITDATTQTTGTITR